jgi:hypothetical protein
MNSITDKKDLVRDEKGAVMIMGLAMILGLIAFMWFLLGIGETLAFRDHMQEAADSAAFTQPAVEALCMNLIVLINFIMIVMVAIYMAWSAVVTAEWASSVLCCPDIWTAIECCPKILPYYNSWKTRNSGAKVMADLDAVLSPLESVIAIAGPWAGTGLSYLSSSDYKMSSMTSKPVGFAVSAMNIPGTFDMGSTTKRFGLPVTHDYLGNDCSHLIDALGQSIIGAFGGSASSGLGKVASGFGSAIGAALQFYYCDNALLPNFSAIAGDLTQSGGTVKSASKDANGNQVNGTTTVDKFPPTDAGDGSGDSNGACNTTNGTSEGAGGWERLIIGGGDAGNYWNCGKYGPMMNYKHPIANPPKKGHDAEYKNDADEMQSFSMLFITGAYSDHHASHNIGLMQLQHMQGFNTAESPPKTYGYYAQAELYFDCNDVWSSKSCDDIIDGSNGSMDMTMYRFEWRSRLVRVHFPGGVGKAADMLNSVLGMVSSVRNFINGNGADEIVQALNFIDQGLGTNIVSQIGSFADPIPGTLNH